MDQTLPTEQELEAMRTVDVHKVDPETLRDIRDVQIKTELPKHRGQAVKQYFEKTENVVFSGDGVASVTPFPLSSAHPEG